MAEFSSHDTDTRCNHEDADDDILRFLDLSPTAATVENKLLEADLSFWADQQSGEIIAQEAGGWVPPVMPLDCSECVVLREVVHSNGLKTMRLSIHGTVGRFYHATLDLSYIDGDGCSSSMEQSFIDLSEQSFEWVKQFLTDYGRLRLRDKYMMAEDSVSAFFDALCARMNNNDDLHLPDDEGLCQFRPATENDGLCRASKSGIAAQRERTGKLHITDLAEYFHLPISEAAKKLRICSTALKKICRKHGMSRWPHRKIKSIDRRISNLSRDFPCNNEEEAVITQAEIDQLRAQKDRICAGGDLRGRSRPQNFLMLFIISYRVNCSLVYWLGASVLFIWTGLESYYVREFLTSALNFPLKKSYLGSGGLALGNRVA